MKVTENNKDTEGVKSSQDINLGNTQKEETKSTSKTKAASSKRKSVGSSQSRAKKKLEESQMQLAEMQDKYIRISAEFDNYRKRTLKEKMELIKTGGEQVILNLLPIIDNLERAMLSIRGAKDADALMEGLELIYNNFKEFLSQNGV
jgi:molecular chaperone GrpE